MADHYTKAKRTTRAAADSLLDVAKDKHAASQKTPTDSVNEAVTRATAERWSTTTTGERG